MLFSVWLALAAAVPAEPQRYSADWEISAQGALSQTWHVQVDGDRMRADLTAYELVDLQLYACPQRAIVRHDLKTIGLVIPYKRSFEEFAYDPAVDLGELDRRDGVEELGVETVNGEGATKLRTTQNGETISFWVAKSDGVLLKAASTGRPTYTLEVRNLKRGPQPASAFELPQAFTRVDRTAEPATEMADRLLGTVIPSFGRLLKTGQLETLPAEQRERVPRECRPAQMPGLFGQ